MSERTPRPITTVEDAMLVFLADADREAWLLMQFALASGAEVVEAEAGEYVLTIPDRLRFDPIGLSIGRCVPILSLALRFASDAMLRLERDRPAFVTPSPRSPTAEERSAERDERVNRFLAHRRAVERAEEEQRHLAAQMGLRARLRRLVAGSKPANTGGDA